MSPQRISIYFFILTTCTLLLVLLSLALGSVAIPFSEVWGILTGQPPSRATWTTIVLDIRLPRSLTAVLAGAGLAVAGLQMQTLFRNPLAEPFILGISSGAMFGVAVLVLAFGASGARFVGNLAFFDQLSTVAGAALGAFGIAALMLTISALVRNSTIVLIVGVMTGAFIGAMTSILVYFATPESIQQFLNWGFGSFKQVTWSSLPLFASLLGVGLLAAGLTVKPLNAFLLGEGYAQSMGVAIRSLRLLTLAGASLIAGVVTAYCGPIGFLGIAAPHLARGLFRTADHRILIPASLLLGSAISLVAALVAELPGQQTVLPLNAAMALLGAPVVAWVLLRMARESS